jgi:hypothetical protein
MKLKEQSQDAFSLLETLLGILVIGLSMVGSFEALRLADLKARHLSIDRRLTELVRENSDYILYAAYDLLPSDGGVLSRGSLYQLYDAPSQSWHNFYNYAVTARVQVSNPGTASEVKNITLSLTYQIDGDSPVSPLKSQTVLSDVIERSKS